CVVATAARADARRRDIGGTKLPVRTAIETSTRETSPTAKPWVSGPGNRSRQPWAPSRLAVLPPAVAAARSGSTGRRNVGHCRPSDTDPTSIEDGVRGMAVQRLRGRLSRDWLFPRKTVIAFALGLGCSGWLGGTGAGPAALHHGRGHRRPDQLRPRRL